MLDCVGCFVQDIVVLFEEGNEGRIGRGRSSRRWRCRRVRIGEWKGNFAEKSKVENVSCCDSLVDVEGRPVDVENEYVGLSGFRCIV